jgi:hypothetical protein
MKTIRLALATALLAATAQADTINSLTLFYPQESPIFSIRSGPYVDTPDYSHLWVFLPTLQAWVREGYIASWGYIQCSGAACLPETVYRTVSGGPDPVSSVPEPSPALLTLGGIGLMYVARRRKA